MYKLCNNFFYSSLTRIIWPIYHDPHCWNDATVSLKIICEEDGSCNNEEIVLIFGMTNKCYYLRVCSTFLYYYLYGKNGILREFYRTAHTFVLDYGWEAGIACPYP